MTKHVQRHSALTDMAECAGGDFSGMKGLMDFFADEVPSISNSKALTVTYIPVVTIYTREA